LPASRVKLHLNTLPPSTAGLRNCLQVTSSTSFGLRRVGGDHNHHGSPTVGMSERWRCAAGERQHGKFGIDGDKRASCDRRPAVVRPGLLWDGGRQRGAPRWGRAIDVVTLGGYAARQPGAHAGVLTQAQAIVRTPMSVSTRVRWCPWQWRHWRQRRRGDGETGKPGGIATCSGAGSVD